MRECRFPKDGNVCFTCSRKRKHSSNQSGGSLRDVTATHEIELTNEEKTESVQNVVLAKEDVILDQLKRELEEKKALK